MPAGFFEGAQQVGERPLELVDDVAIDDLSVGIERRLPGQVDRHGPVGAYGVAETSGLCQIGGVDAFEAHDWTAPPSTLMPCPLMPPLATHAMTAAATSEGSTRRPIG